MTTSLAEPRTPLDNTTAHAVRKIVHRTRGHRQGSITRLVSPGDIGELIKPFVFLDFFSSEPRPGGGFGWHPHSGIATLTVLLEGSTTYEETTGANGTLPRGGVEWMRAGNGVWHTGRPSETQRTVGYQLWVALPPELENGPSASQYLKPEDVPTDGTVRVILGRHEGAASPIAAPPTMNYLVVELKSGAHWTYRPPVGHLVAWVAVHNGTLRAHAPIAAGELAVFQSSNDPIEFVAEGDTAFVIGSAVPHPHELVLGYYSVHTSAEALQRGEAEIQRIGTVRDTQRKLRIPE